MLQAMYREWPFFQMLLSNMDMVLAKSDIAIASRYAELVSDAELRDRIFSRLRAEWQSVDRGIAGDHRPGTSLLESNPLLARSIRNRFPYLDPLNHMQIELLKRYRAGDADDGRRHRHPPDDQRHRRRPAQQRIGAIPRDHGARAPIPARLRLFAGSEGQTSALTAALELVSI